MPADQEHVTPRGLCDEALDRSIALAKIDYEEERDRRSTCYTTPEDREAATLTANFYLQCMRLEEIMAPLRQIYGVNYDYDYLEGKVIKSLADIAPRNEIERMRASKAVLFAIVSGKLTEQGLRHIAGPQYCDVYMRSAARASQASASQLDALEKAHSIRRNQADTQCTGPAAQVLTIEHAAEASSGEAVDDSEQPPPPMLGEPAAETPPAIDFSKAANRIRGRQS